MTGTLPRSRICRAVSWSGANAVTSNTQPSVPSPGSTSSPGTSFWLTCATPGMASTSATPSIAVMRRIPGPAWMTNRSPTSVGASSAPSNARWSPSASRITSWTGSACTARSMKVRRFPPPGRPLTSMTTGPASVHFSSTCRTPDSTPTARTASAAASTSAWRVCVDTSAGNTWPVSRNPFASGVRPVTPSAATSPWLARISTETYGAVQDGIGETLGSGMKVSTSIRPGVAVPSAARSSASDASFATFWLETPRRGLMTSGNPTCSTTDARTAGSASSSTSQKSGVGSP